MTTTFTTAGFARAVKAARDSGHITKGEIESLLSMLEEGSMGLGVEADEAPALEAVALRQHSRLLSKLFVSLEEVL